MEGESYGVYWCSKMSMYMGILRAKHSKNRRKTKSRRRKTRTAARTRARMAVRTPTTASPWWPLSYPVYMLLERRVLASFGP